FNNRRIPIDKLIHRVPIHFWFTKRVFIFRWFSAIHTMKKLFNSICCGTIDLIDDRRIPPDNRHISIMISRRFSDIFKCIVFRKFDRRVDRSRRKFSRFSFSNLHECWFNATINNTYTKEKENNKKYKRNDKYIPPWRRCQFSIKWQSISKHKKPPLQQFMLV